MTKKIIALFSVILILIAGLFAVKSAYQNADTTNVVIKTVEGAGAMDEQYIYIKDDVQVAHTAADSSSATGYKLVWDLEVYDEEGNFDEDLLRAQLDPDSIADIIVYYNTVERKAANDVASIVFDFRGFDTIGEALILSTAICGSFCILYIAKKDKKEGQA